MNVPFSPSESGGCAAAMRYRNGDLQTVRSFTNQRPIQEGPIKHRQQSFLNNFVGTFLASCHFPQHLKFSVRSERPQLQVTRQVESHNSALTHVLLQLLQCDGEFRRDRQQCSALYPRQRAVNLMV